MFRLVAVLLICGATLVTASTVRAAQPAAVQNDRFCIPFGLNTTLCSWVKLVQHTSTQPDGDQSIVYHTDQAMRYPAQWVWMSQCRPPKIFTS
jgi:hypothetical protein